jgi:hypothetical protein
MEHVGDSDECCFPKSHKSACFDFNDVDSNSVQIRSLQNIPNLWIACVVSPHSDPVR